MHTARMQISIRALCISIVAVRGLLMRPAHAQTSTQVPPNRQASKSHQIAAVSGTERELCLLKEIAEGTYKTKHAEAARLDYTTTHRHIDTNMNKDRPSIKA